MEKVNLSPSAPQYISQTHPPKDRSIPPTTTSTPIPPNQNPSYITQIPPSIASNLHNKNKKKGFKQSMDGLVAQKIVFGSSGPGSISSGMGGGGGGEDRDGPVATSSSSTVAIAAFSSSYANGATRTNTNHLVQDSHLVSEIPETRPRNEKEKSKANWIRYTPPSEQPNLPSNILVTSVDVEAGYWPTQREEEYHANGMGVGGGGKRGKKRKGKSRENGSGRWYEEDAYGEENAYGEEEADVQLKYDEDDSNSLNPSQIPTQTQTKPTSGPNFDEIEKRFDSLPLIKNLPPSVPYPPGTVLAYKELDIDPVTLTPQELLKLVSVEGEDGEGEGKKFELREIRRGGVVAFGGGQVGGDGNEVGDEDGDGKFSVDLSEMIEGGWRVVT